MTLQLNESVQPYKEFPGRNTEQMPLLIKEKRTPLSIYGLGQRRIQVLGEEFSDEVRDSWWNNYFDTGDGAAYDTEGNMKFVPDAQLLRNITPQSNIKGGALVFPDDVYESLPGTSFTKAELQKHAGRWLRKGEPRENPLWQAKFRGDQNTLVAYEDAAFERASQYGHTVAMGVFPDSPSKHHKMRAWGVVGVNYGQSGACSGSNINLGGNGGRLVGVAPEAHAGRKIERPTNGIVTPSLEQVLGLEHAFIEGGRSAYEAAARKLFK